MSKLQQIIDRTKRLVFFGGAGVSTASGIPDFRSANGLYGTPFEGFDPETLLSSTFLYLHPELFFDYYRSHILYPQAKPNACHRQLFALEKANKLYGVVTQNVDGLHRIAGNIRLYELHGSVWENECVECGASYSLQWMAATTGIPRCPECGCMVRPLITLYGEAPNKYVMMGATREIARCDTLIVAGTSLCVEPAASLIDHFEGKELVIINRDETPADSRASLVIHDDIDKVMGALTV